jgi:hypothetical protein
MAEESARSSGRARRRRLRVARLRAALLALVFAAQGLAACPIVPLSPERLARPGRQLALDRWAARLGRVGLPMTPDALAATLMSTTRRLDALRAQALTPAKPYFDLTRTDQRWGLFLDAHATRYRMHIETQDASGAWSLRYRPLDPGARTLAGPIEYRRVRASWNPRVQATRPPYEPFVDWVARTLFEREPRAQAVRVRMERFHIPRPGEPPDPATSWHFVELRSRPGSAPTP